MMVIDCCSLSGTVRLPASGQERHSGRCSYQATRLIEGSCARARLVNCLCKQLLCTCLFLVRYTYRAQPHVACKRGWVRKSQRARSLAL